MGLDIALVSTDNGVGLSTDMDLLTGVFESAGHHVERVFWEETTMRQVDLVIFLELFNPKLIKFAKKSVGIFNMEWFGSRWLPYLGNLDQIWAKSEEAHTLFKGMRLPVVYTGFMSKDHFDPTIERTDTALHVRGRSTAKNTAAVINAWQLNPNLPPLTIITATALGAPSYINVVGRQTPEQLQWHMNTHRFHICPSLVEGWGHYITEGALCEALVITTDGSPMNEHITPDCGILIDTLTPTLHGGTLVNEYKIAPVILSEAVEWASKLDRQEADDMGRAARQRVLERADTFVATVLNQLDVLFPERSLR